MRVRVLVFLAWLCGIAFALADHSRLRAEHAAAARLLGDQKWKEAAAHYRRILEQGVGDPLEPNACLGLARSLTGAGSHEEALSVLQGLPARLSGRDRGRGREVVNLWRYAAYRERARILASQGKIEDAWREFRSAVGIIGEAGVNEGLRARTRMEAAELLSAAGRRKEAIALLASYPEELQSPHWAGLRARQRAALARIFLDDGERDWAVTMLERIRDDPELDEQQFQVAEAFAEGKDWRRPVTGKLRVWRAGTTLRIEAEGQFELGVALPSAEEQDTRTRAGTITAWFNLASDPFKTTNLVGPPGGALLRFGIGRKTSEHEPEVAFEVLEESAARIRFRTRQLAWPHRVENYTVYPTGQLFAGASLVLESKEPRRRIEKLALHCAQDSGVNWMQSAAGGECMIGETALSHESPFHLAHSNPLPAPQISVPDDLLLVPASAGVYSGYFMPGRITLWSRLGMSIPCPATGDRFAFACQVRILPRTIDSLEEAAKFVDDYQSPARIELADGAVVINDPGDLNGDGFNESEGCHVVKSASRFTLIAGGSPRHEPVFKILESKLIGLPDLFVNGKKVGRKDYNLARLDRQSLLVQWKAVLPAGEKAEVELK